MLAEDEKNRLSRIAHCMFPEPADPEFQDLCTDRTRIRGESVAVAFPESVTQIAELVRFARDHGISIVPSGGRTGYAGGAVATGGLVVSMRGMNRLLGTDPALPAMTVQAGMITADAHKAADSMGLCFPVDFASSGSSQIGGNIATNAGGIRVIRYGMIRNWVLGLTVVTGSGEIIHTGSNVRKDNTGPDLTQWFIGSEGIFGIVAEAVLRLDRKPRDTMVALGGVSDFRALQALLSQFREHMDLLAFECFDQKSLEIVRAHLDLPRPVSESPWYVLLEWETGQEIPDAPCELRIAETSEQKKHLWRYRESISESLSQHTIYKNDVSIPLSRMTEYTDVARREASVLGIDIALFGHAGDGNLHVNLIAPVGMQSEIFEQKAREFTNISYAMIRDMGGSISAEHGIGILKRDDFLNYAPPEKIRLLREMKKLFDPDGIMNPGKLV